MTHHSPHSLHIVILVKLFKLFFDIILNIEYNSTTTSSRVGVLAVLVVNMYGVYYSSIYIYTYVDT